MTEYHFDPLTEAAIEWLQGEREGMSRSFLVQEITRLATNCKLWPLATAREWNEAVDRAIESGSIAESEGLLRIATTVAVEPVRQLELF